MTIYRNETPVVYAARFISAHNPFEQLMTMNDVAEGQLYASSRVCTRRFARRGARHEPHEENGGGSDQEKRNSESRHAMALQ